MLLVFLILKFYCIYSKMFLLIESFLSSERLGVIEKYKPSSKGAISSGMRQNFILIHLIVFYFSCLPDDGLCKIPI